MHANAQHSRKLRQNNVLGFLTNKLHVHAKMVYTQQCKSAEFMCIIYIELHTEIHSLPHIAYN